MLTELLTDIGLHRRGEPLDLQRCLVPFSDGLDAQQIAEHDVLLICCRVAPDIF